jgi:O-antigen/teichoic acid export membrane protein
MNFFRNAFQQLATKFAGIPLGIATSIVLARFLSVADRGTLALLIAYATLMVLLSQFGWASASIYRLRRVGSDSAKVAGAALYAVIFSSLLVIVVCVAFRTQLTERFFHGVPAGLYYVVLLMVPFQLLGLNFGALARAIDRFTLQNLYSIGTNVGNLAAAVAVLVLWGRGLDEILVANLVVQAIAAIWLTGATLRHTGLTARVDVVEAVESLRFGLKSYVTSLTGKVHERVDLFMLAFFLAAPEEVAYYAIACSVLERIQMVPEAVGTALFPKLAGLTDDQAGRFASYVSRHSLAWVVVTILVLGASGPFLIPILYGSEYRSSVAPFLLLLPGVGAITIYRVLGRYFQALGRQSINVGTQLASAATNILLNIWLIPRYGVIGAASASLVSYCLESVLITLAFLRASGSGFADTFVFKAADLTPYRERFARLRHRRGAGRGRLAKARGGE